MTELDEAPCPLCSHSLHEPDDCEAQVGYDHINGDHYCGCPGISEYQRGIADFVNKVSVEYRKHSALAVQEDVLTAVAHFDVPAEAFWSDDEKQAEILRTRAALFKLTGEVPQ